VDGSLEAFIEAGSGLKAEFLLGSTYIQATLWLSIRLCNVPFDPPLKSGKLSNPLR